MHNFALTIPKARPAFWFFIFLFSSVLIKSYGGEATNGDYNVIRIGAIIDVNSRIGKEQQVAMEIAAQNYNNTSTSHKLALYFQNPTKEPYRAISLAEELISKQKVQVIIGTQTWQEASLMAGVATQTQVPIISFSSPAITPPLTPKRWPFLLRLANNITAHINCIADILHTFTWQRVILIHEDDGYGTGAGDYAMLHLLSETLQTFGSTIEYRLALPPFSLLSDPTKFIQQELIKLIEQSVQSRVFIVLHSSLEMVTILFREASQIGLVDRDSAWIIPESITNVLDSVDKSGISYMEGSLGIKTNYCEDSSEFHDFRAQFRRSFRAKNPEEDNSNPGFYALQAHDSIKIVIEAIERSNSSRASLLREIMASNFHGLSGEIHFDEAGQLLQNPTLRVVNVVGKSYKEIEFWSQELGFFKGNNNNNNNNSGRTQGLDGVVQWPGNLQRNPKGWKMPVKQKPMKIAVPGRTSFSKFVKVEYGENPAKNKYSGFCIRIFDKVLQLLEYDLPYEFYPLNVTYPELVHLVYNKTYDAVVGDMTILSKRVEFVDFSVPFAESGLSMIVAAKSEESSWMFLKPFTWQLWAITGLIFLYTVLVVWYLERLPNPEFHGDLRTQISTALWFTISSLFLAHTEKMHSNLSRVAMVAWLFLVMILNSSYTASLSSMLTVQQLRPNVTSIEWLKRNNMKIGCDGDSFIRTYLEEVAGFSPENIINISDEYNYDGAFRNNSIAAAFLELPYEKLYINKYCKDYSGFTPISRFGGLGFMFHKGSPVGKDVSKAILKLSENGDLKTLEEELLYSSNECSNNTSSNDTQSLKLGSLWVLYVFSGITSTICLLFSFMSRLSFFQALQNVVQEYGNGSKSHMSIWIRAIQLAKHIFSRKLYKESSEAQQDVTNCSLRWDCIGSTSKHVHRQDSTSPVQAIIRLPSPPSLQIQMENPAYR